MYKYLTNLQRIGFITILLTIASISLAVPAKRGIWKQLRLNDGTVVEAELRGDESFHYWRTADGKFIIGQGDGYVLVKDAGEWDVRRKTLSSKPNARRAARQQIHRSSTCIGKKKGLLLLVEFVDQKFQSGHDISFYECVANKEGFTSNEGYVGSVHDYFLQQSNGLFDLSFDVIGPISLSHDYSYYGENDEDGNDKRPGKMVAEALIKADNMVNYADYDWNGNGEVDMVMVIYAGRGEADSYEENTIWPHEWELSSSDYLKVLRLDSMIIDVYACANEMGDKKSSGIGAICHEFSHAIGLPDMYDSSGINYGMGYWSLMDLGVYNGDCFCPCGYTSYEKMFCGWIEPVILNNDTTISNMKPLSIGGEAYLLQNEGWKDEYYLLENRQKSGWDAYLPGNGLLILHVDYSKRIWFYNEVNCTSEKQTYTKNDHQRCTIFFADNSPWNESGDPYPYKDNNQLTAVSKPAATLYHENVDSSIFMGKSITAITQNRDRTIAFTVGPQKFEVDGITLQPSPLALQSSSIYSLDGRYLGTDINQLKPGIYIVGGKKVIVPVRNGARTN